MNATISTTAQDHSSHNLNNERRFTTVTTQERLHFAQGLLGLEENLLTLELEDRI
jgi:hypothetical protein